jgi:hypothetical protein
VGRARAIDEIVDVRGELGENGLRLRGGQLARGDRPVEPRLRAGEDRRLQPVDRLALRGRDLRERLAAPELRAQLRFGQPEVLRRRSTEAGRACAVRRPARPGDDVVEVRLQVGETVCSCAAVSRPLATA